MSASSSSSLACAKPTADNNSNSNASCVPCSTLDPSARLTFEQAKEQLSSMLEQIQPNTDGTSSSSSSGLWTLRERTPSNSSSPSPSYSLVRTYTAKNFQTALDSINDMGVIAEQEGHHPDFRLYNYRNVEVEIFTHKLDGLTSNDFVLAQKLTTNVQIVYSPKWLSSHPEAKSTSK